METLASQKDKWYCQKRAVSATLLFSFVFVILVSTAMLGGKIGLNSTADTSRDFFVEVFGSDVVGDGSQARPFATITRASRAASPGSVIRVGPGHYNLSSVIYTGASGLQNKPIVYLSVVEWGARLHAAHAGEALWLNRGSFVEIRGFDISGGHRTGVWTEGRSVTLSRNFIHDLGANVQWCGQTAAGIYAPASRVYTPQTFGSNVFTQNVIVRVGGAKCGAAPALADGIYTEGIRDTIANNIILSNQGSGITVSCSAPPCSALSVSVIFNLLANNTASGLSLLVRGTTSNKDAPVGLVANNIVIFNSAYALYSSQPFDGTSFSTMTNIIKGNSLGCSSQPSSFVCANQIFRAPGFSISTLFSSTTAAGLSRLLLDFVPKCHPLSPCIGSGSALPASPSPATLVDFNNQPRLSSSPSDIGPFLSTNKC